MPGQTSKWITGRRGKSYIEGNLGLKKPDKTYNDIKVTGLIRDRIYLPVLSCLEKYSFPCCFLGNLVSVKCRFVMDSSVVFCIPLETSYVCRQVGQGPRGSTWPLRGPTSRHRRLNSQKPVGTEMESPN